MMKNMKTDLTEELKIIRALLAQCKPDLSREALEEAERKQDEGRQSPERGR